ncbi:hypothetical protein FRC12_002801 [Ceratobasidium sp. 428]|nr:hypothetical protein FRC12_002801 [Ceratobasidium sp. 428]
MGRFSPFYGGHHGVPRVLSSAGGVLAGFTGRMTNSGGDRNTVGRVQTIWRHDISHSSSLSGGRQTTYIGGPGGSAFNDWPFIGPPHSARIKQVNIWCGDVIDSIQASLNIRYSVKYQITYSQQTIGGTMELKAAPHCSEPGGGKQSFELDSEEHIIAVSGDQEKSQVLRLCFFTNKGMLLIIGNLRSYQIEILNWLGRTSPMYGNHNGKAFMHQPKTVDGKSMRLAFIMGKQ